MPIPIEIASAASTAAADALGQGPLHIGSHVVESLLKLGYITLTENYECLSLDTAGIGQGRKPRELFCVEWQYDATDGKRKRAAVLVQRKSDALGVVKSWDKHSSKLVPDTSTVHLSRGIITWEPLPTQP